MIKKTYVDNWQVFPTADDVANKALDLILQISKESIDANGIFKIVLAGGTTPMHIYQLLAKQNCDWGKWHLFLGDERCLPENNSERNSNMIRECLLKKINIPNENIHFIPAELGAKSAAKAYADDILNQLPFDLVMLGMGEDGHTASLFPGHLHDDKELVHEVYNSPKPPSDRVSMSSSTLSNNYNLMILITGENKKIAINQWKQGLELPVSSVTSFDKKLVLLDQIATNLIN